MGVEPLQDIERMGIGIARVKNLDVGGSYIAARRVVLISADLDDSEERAVARGLVRVILEDQLRRPSLR